jgi:hypothetical protein
MPRMARARSNAAGVTPELARVARACSSTTLLVNEDAAAGASRRRARPLAIQKPPEQQRAIYAATGAGAQLMVIRFRKDSG